MRGMPSSWTQPVRNGLKRLVIAGLWTGEREPESRMRLRGEALPADPYRQSGAGGSHGHHYVLEFKDPRFGPWKALFP